MSETTPPTAASTEGADILDNLTVGDGPIPVPGAPNVFVRVMSGEDGDAWDEFTSKAEKNSQVQAKLSVMCACNKEGKPLWKAGQEGELARRLSRPMLQRIWNAAWELNKLGTAGVEDAKNGSGPDATSASGSSSAGPSA